MAPSRHSGFLDSISEFEQDVPVIDSIWKMVSLEQLSNPEYSSLQISYIDLLSYNFQRLALSKPFDMHRVNPFDLQSRSLIGPVLESFLQNINSIYFLVNPFDLWSYVDSVLDPNFNAPTLTMSLVCLCIAIGYQTRPIEVPDMATTWYENGRRYFDGRDWNLDPTAMQILALISMFHMAQRPSTSSHYLSTDSLDL
jgi:hypothetical protein